MSDILDPNYETVSATCEHCEALCIFSRIDDLGETMPISGRRVDCSACGKQFWIKGDTINSAYRFLIDDAKDHFRIKRYMPAIASLAQAWEVFFAACALSTYVYRPFFSAAPLDRDVDELNRVHRELHEAIKSFTWFPMRNLVLNMLLTEPRPATIDDASTHIATLSALGNEPSPLAVAAVADTRKRETLEGLAALTVGRLRNNVVHKHAYRPTRAEVEPCLTSEISTLYRVKHRLGVGDFLEHQFDTVYMEE
jgi:hypothetical protein